MSRAKKSSSAVTLQQMARQGPFIGLKGRHSYACVLVQPLLGVGGLLLLVLLIVPRLRREMRLYVCTVRYCHEGICKGYSMNA